MRVVSAFFILVIVLSFAALPVRAQDEVDVEYGDTVTYDFDEDNDEVVFVFEGQRGDVISAVAAFEYSDDLDYSATIELELDNADDDRIARSENLDYLFATPGMIVELDERGEYRLHANFDGDGEATMVLTLDETAYLSDEPASFEVASEGLPTLVGVSVDDDGLYQIDLTLDRGEMNFNFYLLELASDYPTTLANVSGTSVQGWSVVVDLEGGQDYVATLGSLLSLVFDDNRRVDGEVSMTLVPFED